MKITKLASPASCSPQCRLLQCAIGLLDEQGLPIGSEHEVATRIEGYGVRKIGFAISG